MNRPVRILLLLQFLGGAILVAQRTFFPLYADGAGLSPTAIAFVNGGRQITGMLAALIGGYLADAIGRKWTYFAGNVAFLFSGLLFLSDSPTAVSVLWIASGFLFGLRTLGGQSYLVDAAESRRLGMTSALFTWGTTIGGATGTLLLGVLLDRSGYGPFASSLLSLAAVVLLLNALAMPRLRSGPRVDSRRHASYRSLLRRPDVLMLTALRFLPTFYWGMAIVLIPLLLVDLGGSTLTVAAYGTVSQVAASIAQILTGRFVDKRGPRVPSMVVLIGLVIAIVGTAVFAGNLVMVFAMSAVAASAAWSMSALVPVLVAISLPLEHRAKTLGWIHLWWNIGMVVGSSVGGALFEAGRALPFAVAGVLMVAAPFVAHRLTTGAPQGEAGV